MLVYATPSQYSRFAEESYEDDSSKLQKRLRSASVEVQTLTRSAVYAVNAEGMPLDARILEAFADATCAIVEHWEGTDDPFGIEANAGAVKIGSVSLGTTSSSNSNLTEREKLTRRIGERALNILNNAGLFNVTVGHS